MMPVYHPPVLSTIQMPQDSLLKLRANTASSGKASWVAPKGRGHLLLLPSAAPDPL